MKPWLNHIPWLPAICSAYGLENVVLSPGSRCAPLTLAFVRHPGMKTYSVPDERSAAFIGLGMAIQNQKASILICTSGTAALNYAPAVAEAFYQEVPLLVLTADRPEKWIDQWDGQTIRQKHLYGQHAKASFVLPEDCSSETNLDNAKAILEEAIQIAGAYPKGPVHINIPINEPFYPEPNEVWEAKSFTKADFKSGVIESHFEIPSEIGYEKIMLVAGHENPLSELKPVLDKLAAHPQVVFLSDVISNQTDVAAALRLQDVYIGKLSTEKKQSLKPRVLLTFGKSLISKNLKLFLRDFKPEFHYHISERSILPDPFLSQPKSIPVHPKKFLPKLWNHLKNEGEKSSWKESWIALEKQSTDLQEQFVKECSYSELKVCYHFLNALPANSVLHLANSMAVRYVNFFSHLLESKGIEIVANRGTSGIDGSNSTAVGYALKTDKQVFLLSGDMSFLYDRNAFWHNYSYPNLKVLVINNGGGGIFRLIDGPASQPELEEWFETRQTKSAKFIALEYGMEYSKAENQDEIQANLNSFVQSDSKSGIFEVFTDKYQNQQVFKEFHHFIKMNL